MNADLGVLESGDSPAADCVVTAFCSYTQGVGVTTLLSSVAMELAAAGARVLLVDLDLGAPTLDRFFAPFIHPSGRAVLGDEGFLDMIESYQGSLREPVAGNGTPAAEHAAEHAALRGRPITLVPQEFRWHGSIDLLGPGRRGRPLDQHYLDRVARLDAAGFLDRDDGLAFLDAFRESCRSQGYQHVLIDTRPGHSGVARAYVNVLADVVVLGFSPESLPSLEGGSLLAGSVPENVRLLPVQLSKSGVPDPAWKRSTAKKFDHFLRDMDEQAREVYWTDTRVEYEQRLARPESVGWLHEGFLATSARRAYRSIAERISPVALPSPEPVPESQRRRLLSAYQAIQHEDARTAIVLAAPADEQWKRWIESRLAARGIEPRPLGADHRQTMEETDLVFAVLGDTAADPAGFPELRGLLTQHTAGQRSKYYGIPVADVQVDDGLRNLFVVPQLTGDARTGEAVLATILPREYEAGELPDVPYPIRSAPSRVTGEPAADGARPGPGTGGPRTGDTGAPRLTGLHNVPARNRYFVGREKVFEELRALLRQDAPAIAVLEGVTGSGKTQIALEYVWRFQADFDLVWWVPARRPDELRDSLVRLGERLRPGSRRSAREVMTDLAGHPRSLVVLDDAVEPADAAAILPADPDVRPRVLVTTAEPGWNGSGTVVEVGGLAPDDARRLVRLRMPDALVSEARQVAARVGALVDHLPLALEQAGSWVQAARGESLITDPLEVYVGRFEGAVAGWREDTAKAEAALKSVWAGAPALEDLRPAARRLLEICSYLAPDGIGGELLRSRAMLAELNRADLPFRAGGGTVAQVVREISRASLAEFDHQADAFRMHRLVQVLVRRRMPSRSHRRAARTAAQTVLAAYAPVDAEMDRPVHRPRYRELQRHLEQSDAPRSDDPEVRRWLVNQVRFLYLDNRLAPAKELATRLKRDWTARHGRDDLYLLRLTLQLANVCRALGEYQDAADLDREALGRLAVELGPSHPISLAARRGRGGDLRSLGRFGEAVDEDQTTYTNFVAVLGEEDPDTLMAAHNLALSHYLAGNVQVALAKQSEVYLAHLRVMGTQHPYTWDAAVSLAVYYRESGDLESSRRLLEQALAELESLEGPEGGFSMGARRQLAATLRHLAVERPEVLPREDGLLERYMALHRELHPATLACAVGEAALLHARGDTEAAHALAGRTGESYRAAFGDAHPFTLMCLSNLSVYALSLGLADEAENAAKTAYQGMANAPGLGAQHPFTLAAAVAHANVLAALEQDDDAREFDEQVLRGYQALDADPRRLELAQAHLAWHGRAPGARPERHAVEFDIPAT